MKIIIEKNPKGGECYSINAKGINGHKGLIGKTRKNGKVDAVILTHARKSFGKKNIKLQENPQPGDSRDAYIVRKKQQVHKKHLGKKHPDVKVKNKTDKSTIRKIKSQK